MDLPSHFGHAPPTRATIARVLAVSLAAVYLLACGDDGTPTDAGADARADAGDGASVDGATDGGREVTAPTPPNRPEFGPCPAGWRAIDADGVPACDPWPVGGLTECASDEAFFPGETGCALVGTPCTADGWPAVIEESDDVRYVRAGAAAGGDGSRGAPFATLAAAAAGATDATVLAVGLGRYDELLRFDVGMTVTGACTRGTSIGAVEVYTEGARLENLLIGPVDDFGVYVDEGGTLDVAGIVISEATAGLRARVGGVIRGRDVSVRNTVDAPGDAIGAYSGATIELDRVSISRARVDGVYATGSASRVTLRDVVVRATQPDDDGDGGRGIFATDGAVIQAERAALEGNRTVGALATSGARIELRDAVIRGTESRESDGRFGRGASAFSGASLLLERVLIEGNRTTGVYVGESGSALTATDLVVRDMLSQAATGRWGRGVSIAEGATATLERIHLRRTRDVGLFIYDRGAATVTDLVVREVLDQEPAPAAGGWGIALQAGATLALTRASVDDVSQMGVFLSGAATELTAVDLIVSDVESLSTTGAMGRGLNLQGGATATLTRAHLESLREVAVIALDENTTLAADDLVVTDVRDAACVVDGCDGNAGALAAFGGARVTLHRFLLLDSALCGVWLEGGGEIDLVSGAVRGHTIGACVLTEGYDFGRLSAEVEYTDNESNLDAPSLPLPVPGTPLVASD